jgi:serine/threonine protein phosphatase PrpC
MRATLKSYACVTESGSLVDLNEDAYLADSKDGLFLAVDAFGGSGHGDQLARRVTSDFKNAFLHLSDDADKTMPFYWSARWSIEGNALVNAALKLHKSALEENKHKQLNQKAAASMACVYLGSPLSMIYSVGVFQSYLLRTGLLSVVASSDVLHLDQRDYLENKKMLIPGHALGLFPDLQWKMQEMSFQEGDFLMLLGPGIYQHLNLSEIEYILKNAQHTTKEKLHSLVNLSVSRGSYSNQSGILLEF